MLGDLQAFFTAQVGAEAAQVIMAGLPNMLGTNMSSRLGTGAVLSPFEFARTGRGDGIRESVPEYIFTALGRLLVWESRWPRDCLRTCQRET